MKIKGVQAGINKGKPLEYSPEEKPLIMLKDHIALSAPIDEVWWIEPDSLKLSKQQHSKMGVTPQGFANNAYIAEGEFILRRLTTSNDKLHKGQLKKFYMEFVDCLDEHSMPDMKVNRFDIE